MEHETFDLDFASPRRDDQSRGYTIYPTVERFRNDFTAGDYARWARRRNVAGALRPLSLSVHLPVPTSERYFSALEKEIALKARLVRGDRRVLRVRCFGGAAAPDRTDDLLRVDAMLSSAFELDPGDDRLSARDLAGDPAHSESDLIGFGVSAIGAIGPAYNQNARTLSRYYDCLARDELPIERGLVLTPDDLIRRSVIEALMCRFVVSKESIEIGYLVDFDSYFAPELAALQPLQAVGLVDTQKRWIAVTPEGRQLVRNICRVFDKYLCTSAASVRYSRGI